MSVRRSLACFLAVAGWLGLSLGPLLAPSTAAQPRALRLAVISSLGGDAETTSGRSFLDGARLAVDEANAERAGPPIELDVYDSGRGGEGAREAAGKVAASEAIGVVGPLLSTSSLAAGPIFAKAGIASIVSAAESDLVTANATTFRANFKNSDLGNWLAVYLRHVLGGQNAVVLFVDDGYGRTIADGFQRGATRLGLRAAYVGFTTAEERDAAVMKAAADPEKPAIVLATLDVDGAAMVTELRRLGVKAPILAGTGPADQAFANRFRNLPEERESRGFFTRDLFAAAPVLLDSANDDTRAFADRFRARFGRALPVSWIAVQGYDGARLAIAAARAAARDHAGGDVRVLRQAFLGFLDSLDGPARAVPGLLGPIWFTPDRGRLLPVRIGWFREGLFESAPVQLVPVSHPDRKEIASGTLVEIEPDSYARRQKVVYAGMFLNDLARIDIAQSTFTADFYLWMRYDRRFASADADPTQIEFPHLVRGSFAASRPSNGHDLDDGTTYRLWRVTGDFKSNFDLHRYPADSQSMEIAFFNERAASDRLVYVIDSSSLDAATPGVGQASQFGAAAPEAFRNLTQWEPIRVATVIDNLVAPSALGDPALVGLERMRELSGFRMRIEVRRDISTTLIKTLLPIGLMTLIMFSTLYFPPALAATRVTVAITAGLSGAVLLAAINAHLGNVGYVIAVEYGFYVFFALCLLCIIVVLLGERLRLAGRPTTAVDRTGRIVFAVAFFGVLVAAGVAFAQWR